MSRAIVIHTTACLSARCGGDAPFAIAVIGDCLRAAVGGVERAVLRRITRFFARGAAAAVVRLVAMRLAVQGLATI